MFDRTNAELLPMHEFKQLTGENLNESAIIDGQEYLYSLSLYFDTEKICESNGAFYISDIWYPDLSINTISGTYK